MMTHNICGEVILRYKKVCVGCAICAPFFCMYALGQKLPKMDQYHNEPLQALYKIEPKDHPMITQGSPKDEELNLSKFC